MYGFSWRSVVVMLVFSIIPILGSYRRQQLVIGTYCCGYFPIQKFKGGGGGGILISLFVLCFVSALQGVLVKTVKGHMAIEMWNMLLFDASFLK